MTRIRVRRTVGETWSKVRTHSVKTAGVTVAARRSARKRSNRMNRYVSLKKLRPRDFLSAKYAAICCPSRERQVHVTVAPRPGLRVPHREDRRRRGGGRRRSP